MASVNDKNRHTNYGPSIPSWEISTHLDYDENEANEGKQCAEDNDCDCCEAKVIILIICEGSPIEGSPGELCEGRFWIIFLSDI